MNKLVGGAKQIKFNSHKFSPRKSNLALAEEVDFGSDVGGVAAKKKESFDETIKFKLVTRYWWGEGARRVCLINGNPINTCG